MTPHRKIKRRTEVQTHRKGAFLRTLGKQAGSTRSTVVIFGGIIVAMATITIWWTSWVSLPEPPLPADLDRVDKEVVSLIRQTSSTVSASPRIPEGWVTLGMVYEANGFIGLARDCYIQATTIHDSDARWWYRLAVVQARLGNIDAALTSIKRTLDLVNGYAPAYWRKGFWLFDRGEVEEAELAFRRATEIDVDDASGWIGLARVFLLRRQPEKTIEVLEMLLGRRPGERYALQLLGRAYRQKGRVADAKITMAMGADSEPTLIDPWSEQLAKYQRGYAALLKSATRHRVAGELDAAIEIYEELRIQRNDDLALLNRLASTYLIAGRHGEGLELLKVALDRDPNYVETQVNLASAFLRTNNFEFATTHAMRALGLNPRFSRAYEVRAMILWRNDQHEEAIAAFRNVVRYNPRHQMALVWIGMIQTELGRLEAALKSFELAIAKTPTLTEGWLGVAKATMSLRRFDDSDVAFRRAIQLNGVTREIEAGLTELQALRAKYENGGVTAAEAWRP